MLDAALATPRRAGGRPTDFSPSSSLIPRPGSAMYYPPKHAMDTKFVVRHVIVQGGPYGEMTRFFNTYERIADTTLYCRGRCMRRHGYHMKSSQRERKQF